jgi:16S rRNA (cytidine1402-2'-O)-methyltransferase
MPGTLYLVATPIGNLEDITQRALRILSEADMIAAEDTRRSLALLSHFAIRKPLISYHEHSGPAKTEGIISRLKSGQNIALVSDAGMPLLSDPGVALVREARRQGINVTACPGASAGITALALSGLSAKAHMFAGFLDTRGKRRRAELERLSGLRCPIIIYEAPHRIRETLIDCIKAFGDREAALLRELTKLHEEFIGGRLSDIYERFRETDPRGELVLIISGKSEDAGDEDPPDEEDIRVAVQSFIGEGLTEGEAIKKAAKALGIPKREVYRLVKIEETDKGDGDE